MRGVSVWKVLLGVERHVVVEKVEAEAIDGDTMRNHHGHVTITDGPDGGTRVTLTLPGNPPIRFPGGDGPAGPWTEPGPPRSRA